MDWQDDEFEAFLRQFQPSTPKALPTHRWPVVALAGAAVIVAAVVIPTWYGSKGSAVNDSTQTPASTPSASTNTRNRVPQATATPPDAEPRTAAVPASPTLLPFRPAKQPGSAPSTGPVSATSDAGAHRVRVGGAIRPPIKLVDVRPVYPEGAQTLGIDGGVILAIVIGEDGSVIETEVLSSIPELDQAAIDAVSQWLFETTLLNGEPVEVEMVVTVNFTLQ